MKHLVETVLENLSTREYFLFRVLCGVCGTAYGNKQQRFSKAGAQPQSGSRRVFYDALYEQEFRSARLTAIRDAAEQLNYCPVCKRLVCNRCFLICEDLDMCKNCAAELEQQGHPVMPDVLDAAM